MRALRVLSATYLLAACAGPSSSGDKGAAAENISAADSAAIVGVTGRLVVAARAGNWDAWGAEFVADPVRFPPNAPALVGKTAADAFNHASPKFSAFDGTVTFVAGKGDIAVASGTYKLSAPAGKDASGKATPAVNDDGKFMQFLTKQADGTWKIARDIWNSNLPAPGVAAK
jgi:ketosteroid isomerase-like protein